jgi:hypothetical protein
MQLTSTFIILFKIVLSYIKTNFLIIRDNILFYFDLLFINFLFVFFFYEGLLIGLFNSSQGNLSICLLIT